MKKLKKMLSIILGIVSIIIIVGIVVLNLPQFGKNPSGERMARIEKSPNYRNGKFQNLSETPQITSDKGIVRTFWDFIFNKDKDVEPSQAIPSVKTNLFDIKPTENVLVWLGHSSYFMQIDGKKFLIDPVLVSASPFSFMNKPYKGADIYEPKDIPAVDYLIITHDHYDHLDYQTLTQIKDKIGKIVTALGVGSHLEHWGFSAKNITELDWNENTQLTENTKITALPARHFSGRGLKNAQTLWASFMLEISGRTIYIGGDSGYDFFFKDIAHKFPNIDLAILENGQYDEDWRYIHFLPEDLVKAIKDLKPKRVLTFHNSKFTLANHAWYEPLDKILEASQKENFNLATPMIGQVMDLDTNDEKFEKWW